MVKEFGSKEVRMEDDGKVNLVDVAKCLGLTRVAKSGNEVVKWNKKGDSSSVIGKLKLVYESVHDETIKEEAKNIIEEVEESEDRNSIYISNKLAKRIATECRNKTAHEFKDWLVNLDCAREEIEKGNNYINQQQFMEYQNLINGALATVAQQTMSLVGQQTNLIGEQSNLIDKQTNLINKQAKEYANDREELKEFIGLKSSHTKAISTIIMTRCEKAYGTKLSSRDERFKVNRNYLLGQFNVSKYEDISVTKYNEAIELAKTFKIIIIESEKKQKVDEEKIIVINNNGKSKPRRIGQKAEVVERDGKKYKKCSCCGEFKELNEDNFYKRDSNLDGFDGKCRECKRNYYISNRKQRLTYQNNYAHEKGIAIHHQGTFRNNSKYSFLNKEDDE